MEHRLEYDRPAARWTEALPLGNGRLGAMVWGGLDAETLSLNEGTLWSGYPDRWFNEGAREALRESREAFRAGRAAEAQTIVETRMAGRWTQAYLPLGTIGLTWSPAGPVTGYRRWLDLASACTGARGRLAGGRASQEAFVSAPAQILAARFVRPVRSDAVLRLTSPLRGAAEPRGNVLLWSGVAPRFVVPSYQASDDPILWGDSPETSGMRAAFQVWFETDGTWTAGPGGLVITGAREVVLRAAAATSFVDRDTHPFTAGADEVGRTDAVLAAASGSFDELKRDHRCDHRRLYSRCGLRLGASGQTARAETTNRRLEAVREGRSDPGLAALAFHYGRYLLIASSRPGGQPAGLQGLWNQDVRPPWSANYTVNINTEMNYWPAEVTGLTECHEPLLDFLAAVADRGAEVARRHYGARGWTAHHNLDLWAHPIPAGDHGGWFPGSACHLFWPLGGAWLSHHLWERWRFAQDPRELADRIEPVVRGAALFGLDWLVDLGSGPTTYPSTSPENQFVDPEGRRRSVSAGSTCDLASLRQLFSEAREAGLRTGAPADWTARLDRALAELPRPPVLASGALAEWSESYTEAEPGHRHFSHLYGLFPGDQITRARPAEEEAARRAVAERLDHGGGGTGWSLGWLICLQARLADGAGVQASLSRWLGTSVFPNLFDLHPTVEGEPGVFQIDGNFGVTAGIAECLVQSHEDRLRLLPALPPCWAEGSVRGLRVRGGGIIDLDWTGGRLVRVRLRSLKDHHWTLDWRGRILRVRLKAGRSRGWGPAALSP